MISLRSHAISLAAVFLALAIGVMLGSGLLSENLLSSMRAEKRDLHGQINSLNDQKNLLNQKLTAADDFNTQMAPRIVRDALRDTSVVLIRTPDASDDDMEAIRRVIGVAGGSVTSTVALTEEFVAANSAEKLNTVVDTVVLPAGAQLQTNFVDQGSRAGDLLGIALLTDRNPDAPTVSEEQREVVLTALRDTGFLTYPDKTFGAANSAVIVTGGPLGDDAGNQGSTVARFAAAMAPRGSGTVLAGRDGSGSGTGAVAVVRADEALARAVTTVDDIDTEAGRLTAVLALQQLKGESRTGQYGVGPGATSLTVPQ
ncbi:copper transporter [Mycolicibacterium brumae]|uniref:Copper transporter n=1 Tax=Mycolicibacterium brumae TaxID=85968 RepID=A0A2G5P4K4_9MYCO|nr:copper transporter [Mycolicibacterium brumae]MCV7193848.1 copper transporter [Mycolicibacterium brumae]PIB73319.1 copper transporter [Mycolicibacterium brumae]RWA18043.1 hypothetical protein MBRU_18055 [Mycolicibacterium brumae DSM 44177]UWW08855.1 copper transporter [Mycolicibacterium brumae]